MGDLDIIQNGGTTEYNSNAEFIRQLNNLFLECNALSITNELEGCRSWHNKLNCIDRMIYPLLNDKERKELIDLRRKAEVPHTSRPNLRLVLMEKREIDLYERYLRELVHKKGLGVRAGLGAGAAIMR